MKNHAGWNFKKEKSIEKFIKSTDEEISEKFTEIMAYFQNDSIKIKYKQNTKEIGKHDREIIMTCFLNVYSKYIR